MVVDAQATEKHPIHGYVCPDVHGQFEAYRRELGLTSSSALLTLLVLREIKLQRLAGAGARARGKNHRAARERTHFDQGTGRDAWTGIASEGGSERGARPFAHRGRSGERVVERAAVHQDRRLHV